MEISQMKEKGEKQDKEIENLKILCKALESKSNQAEEEIQELKMESETVRMNKTLSDGRVKTLKTRIDSLDEMIKQISNRPDGEPLP